jgi:TDG/mug DNA glycosylase family protein
MVHLRLPPLRDRIQPGVRVLFVGINPGIRSSLTGHHFAGYSNRFWRLLHESGLVPEPIPPTDDDRLPEWRYGITNLVPRATPGIDALRPEEYAAGLVALRRKVRRFKPEVVALVGVSLYRSIFGVRGPVRLGLQRDSFEAARVFVLPNPSGRNANFTYAEMLRAFRKLRNVGRPFRAGVTSLSTRASDRSAMPATPAARSRPDRPTRARPPRR